MIKNHLNRINKILKDIYYIRDEEDIIEFWKFCLKSNILHTYNDSILLNVSNMSKKKIDGDIYEIKSSYEIDVSFVNNEFLKDFFLPYVIEFYKLPI